MAVLRDKKTNTLLFVKGPLLLKKKHSTLKFRAVES